MKYENRSWMGFRSFSLYLIFPWKREREREREREKKRDLEIGDNTRKRLSSEIANFRRKERNYSYNLYHSQRNVHSNIFHRSSSTRISFVIQSDKIQWTGFRIIHYLKIRLVLLLLLWLLLYYGNELKISIYISARSLYIIRRYQAT